MTFRGWQEANAVIAPNARYMRSLLQGTWRDHRGSVYRVSLAGCDHFDAYKFDVHTIRPDGCSPSGSSRLKCVMAGCALFGIPDTS
jgi:hypothetical protein